LPSNGLHTNGYTLARKVALESAGLNPDDYVESLGMSIADALLLVHKSYLEPVRALIEKFDIKGMAHITGGGLAGNLIRILPENTRAVIEKGSWPVLPLFDFIKEKGPVDEEEMYRAFNMGIGFTVLVGADIADDIIGVLKNTGETPYIIGKIESGSREVLLKG
jgi:phosphoribosylformylglycinamidine cyclo-ligase